MKLLDAVTLTGDFADNQTTINRGEVYNKNSVIPLQIDYTKSEDETGLTMQVEFQDVDSTDWFITSRINLETGAISNANLVFSATGKYSIEIPCNKRVGSARVSVKSDSSDGFGTVTVYY